MMVGVLLATYGTPTTADQLSPYLASIRGSELPQPLVDEMRRRYDAIDHWRQGGRVRWLYDVQKTIGDSLHCPVAIGHKHGTPTIEEAVQTLEVRGVTTIAVVITSPFSAPLSTGDYVRRAQVASDKADVVPVLDWGTSLGRYWQRQVASLSKENLLLATAHSLPMVPDETKYEPYVAQFQQLTQDIASVCSCPVIRAFQSGNRWGHWLEPDCQTAVTPYLQEQPRHIVVAPIGFVNDHVEVLYDLDIQLRHYVEQLGGTYCRLPLPHEAIAAPMAEAIRRTVQEGLA